MHTYIPSHRLERSWCPYLRWVNVSNKNTPSMHHPQRRNVTTSVVGLKNDHMHKNLTQNCEPQRSSWGAQKKALPFKQTASLLRPLAWSNLIEKFRCWLGFELYELFVCLFCLGFRMLLYHQKLLQGRNHSTESCWRYPHCKKALVNDNCWSVCSSSLRDKMCGLSRYVSLLDIIPFFVSLSLYSGEINFASGIFFEVLLFHDICTYELLFSSFFFLILLWLYL